MELPDVMGMHVDYWLECWPDRFLAMSNGDDGPGVLGLGPGRAFRLPVPWSW